ncbi:MAG TPA: hypothetical protein VFH63_08855, partial [candidate division Zixibacteria bacterium]|nr:hypothetical protein [candidate division Zixibacteria bacterium]
SGASGPSATAVATPHATSRASRSPAPVVLPTPGRPYDATAVLAAMRASTRPGGVPPELQADAIAAAVAEQLWTWDGRPYPVLQVGGTCGPRACSLELAGTPSGAAGSDLYVFSVVPAASVVRLEAADLHGYPAALDEALDALVRTRLPATELAGLAFTAAAWQPPPNETVMRVAYRSGGEEGAPAVDVIVDVAAGEVLEVRAP